MSLLIGKKSFVALAVLALAVTAPAKDYWVYFGTYTNALSRGIYVSRLDADTGKLSAPELAAESKNANYLNLSPDGKHLYSSNNVKPTGADGNGMVNAFAVDAASGRLTLLNQMPSGSYDPVCVCVSADDKALLVANYDNGSVKSLPILADGRLGPGGSFIPTTGHGPNPFRQTMPHVHYITVDPSHRFALACDLGTDKVMIYRLNTADATLVPDEIPSAAVPPGSGARHLVFSRNGKFAYVISEMGCTITTFAWDAKTGSLTPVETVSALPPGVAMSNSFTAAEIRVRPDGKFIYATVRGPDSVSVFAADRRTGKLTFVQNVPAGGQMPRGLGIDPTGRWLITGNQKTDNAAEFSIDTKTGKLTPTGQSLTIGAPVDVKFVEAQ